MPRTAECSAITAVGLKCLWLHRDIVVEKAGMLEISGLRPSNGWTKAAADPQDCGRGDLFCSGSLANGTFQLSSAT